MCPKYKRRRQSSGRFQRPPYEWESYGRETLTQIRVLKVPGRGMGVLRTREGKQDSEEPRRGRSRVLKVPGSARAPEALAVRRTPIPLPGVFNTRRCESAEGACIVPEGHWAERH